MAMDNTGNAGTDFKLEINETVVEKIANYAAQRIDGIMEMKGNFISTIQEGLGNSDQTKGVKADVHDDQRVSVDLSVVLEYGKSAGEVFDRIKKSVAKDIKEYTDLDIEDLTVHVVDVMTRDEYRKEQENRVIKNNADNKDQQNS